MRPPGEHLSLIGVPLAHTRPRGAQLPSPMDASCRVLDGNAIAKEVRADIARQVTEFVERTGVVGCVPRDLRAALSLTSPAARCSAPDWPWCEWGDAQMKLRMHVRSIGSVRRWASSPSTWSCPRMWSKTHWRRSCARCARMTACTRWCWRCEGVKCVHVALAREHSRQSQLPLPPGLIPGRAARALDPAKDVDGQHPSNIARLVLRDGEPRFAPCTAEVGAAR